MLKLIQINGAFTRWSYRLKGMSVSIRRLYYSIVHGVYCGLWDGSMLPKLGGGRFVDVRRKGSIIDIRDHHSGETIRLVPYQPNHGIMVERIAADGRLRTRRHLDFDMLRTFSDEFELGRRR